MTQPTDEQVIEHIRAHPARLADLCAALALPYRTRYGAYKPAAKALARQLQRLRRAGEIKTGKGQRWEVAPAEQAQEGPSAPLRRTKQRKTYR